MNLWENLFFGGEYVTFSARSHNFRSLNFTRLCFSFQMLYLEAFLIYHIWMAGITFWFLGGVFERIRAVVAFFLS